MENNKSIGNFPIINDGLPNSAVMPTLLFRSEEVFNANHHDTSANVSSFDEFKSVDHTKDVTLVRSFSETVCLKQLEDKCVISSDTCSDGSSIQRGNNSFKRFSVDNLLQNSRFRNYKDNGKLKTSKSRRFRSKGIRFA